MKNYSKLWSDEKYDKESKIGLIILIMFLIAIIFNWPYTSLAITLLLSGVYLFLYKGIKIVPDPYFDTFTEVHQVTATFIGIILIYIASAIFANIIL